MSLSIHMNITIVQREHMKTIIMLPGQLREKETPEQQNRANGN